MGGVHPTLRTSTVIEDYLVTVYRLGVGGEPVRGARLAEQLGVSAASVTETVGRMRQQGLLEPGRRILLSPMGLAMARTLVTRHRLAERFLVDVLGFGWEEVHDEAHRLEHAFSPSVTERLAEFLGHPATCPHGHPIMEDGVAEPELHLRPLSGLAGGTAATVRRIAVEDTPLLAMLSSLGLGLGTAVRVVEADPEDGRLRLEVDGQPRLIDRAAAAEVLVEVG
jgi:DtxR family Mn-dependent transcriptional regulator